MKIGLEKAMSEKKQVSKKDEGEGKIPKKAKKGRKSCAGLSATKIPRTYFVQKL
jgi:hypothetical protein